MLWWGRGSSDVIALLFCVVSFHVVGMLCWNILVLSHFVLSWFVIGFCGGEVGIMTDETIVFALSGWYLLFLW